MNAFSVGTPNSLWETFLLFTIPVGGGIPAGVVLGQSQGIGWIVLTILYLISDVCLAFAFEPILKVIGILSRYVRPLKVVCDVLKESTNRTIARYGTKQGPVTLIAIAFGVDPMTGRAAALAAGHGFIAGWTVAIIGDMFFFLLIMGSTIWLHNVLGDGSVAALIVMGCMLIVPPLIRKVRQRIKSS